MMNHYLMRFFACLLVFTALASNVWAQGFQIDSTVPRTHAIDVRTFDPITITFTAAVDTAALVDENIRVFGSQGGMYDGIVSYDGATQTLTFTPDCAFQEGEWVSVIVQGVQSLGAQIAPAYQWGFVPRVEYGTGRFGPTEEYTSDLGTDPAYLLTADLNDDLLPDLVSANSAASTISVRLNQGQSGVRFSVVQDVAVGNGPYGLASGDLNADGFVDVVVMNLLENTLTVLINDGAANFTATTVQTGERPVRAQVADFNNDGWQDVAVAAFGVDEVYVHINAGNGILNPPTPYAVGASPASLVARDFDNDGYVDLYVAALGDEQLDFLRNDGTGLFEASRVTSLPFAPAALGAQDIRGELDNRFGDTLLELVVSGQDSRDVLILENQGDAGALQNTDQLPIDNTATQTLGLVIADLDTLDVTAEFAGLGKDYDHDIVTAHFSGGEIRTFINDAQTDFFVGSPPIYPSASAPTDRSPLGIASADFDFDGDIDVAVTNSTSGLLTVFYNEGGREAPIDVTPPELAFGDLCLDEDSTQTVQIENTTAYPITVSVSVDPDDGVYTPSTQTLSIGPGGVDSLTVTFDPLVAQNYTAQLVLETRVELQLCADGALPVDYETRLFMSGRGVETVFSAMPDTLDFGVVVIGDSQVETTQVANQGNISGQVTQFELTNPVDFSILNPSVLPLDVVEMTNLPVDVQFQPTTAGTYVDTLRIYTMDDCDQDTLTVILRAEAVDPLPDLIPLNLVEISGLTGAALRTGLTVQFQADLENQFFPTTTTFFNRFEVTTPGGAIVNLGDRQQDGMQVAVVTGIQSDPLVLNEIGTYQVCFIADVNDDVVEEDEANNTLCLTDFTVRESLPDLIATDLFRTSGATDPIRRGQQHDFTGVIESGGELDVTVPFTLAIRINGQILGQTRFDGLAVGETVQFTAPVNFTDLGDFTVDVFADSDGEITELNEENNIFSLTITVEAPDQVTIAPNPFTPNGDTFNDRVTFNVAEFGLTQPEIRIFSFEGRLIRTTTDTDGALMYWDGFDDQGQALRPGVYLFTLNDSGGVVASGHVTLAR